MTIQLFYEQKIQLMILAVIFFIGFIVKMCVARCYRKLISSSEEMGHSEHKLMKTILLKFETCYKLKLNVADVDTFMDKYLYSFRTMGMYLFTWENIGNQFLVLTLLTSVAGGVVGAYYDVEKFEFFSTILCGFLLSGTLIFIDSALNLSMKKQILRIHIKDYLENIYRPRLENQVFHPEEMEKYRDEYFIKEKEEIINPRGRMEQLGKGSDLQLSLSQEEREVIQEVLNEFMA